MFPEVASIRTTTTIWVPLFETIVALVPPKVTEAPVKFPDEAVMVTSVPTGQKLALQKPRLEYMHATKNLEYHLISMEKLLLKLF